MKFLSTVQSFFVLICCLCVFSACQTGSTDTAKTEASTVAVEEGAKVETENTGTNAGEADKSDPDGFGAPDKIQDVKKEDLSFTHHLKNNTPKAKTDQYVYYHLTLRNETGELTNTYSRPPQKMKIPDLNKITYSVQPLLQGLMRMSVGDSLTIKQKMHEGATNQDGTTPLKTLYYDIKMLDIKDN